MRVVGIVKSLVLAQGFLAGIFSCILVGDDGKHLLGEAVPGALVGIVAMPFIMSLIIRLNVASGYLTPPFKPPVWNDNPFNSKNPLPFFQFASAYFGVLGIGAVLTTPWYGLAAVPGIIVGFAGALGIYLGVRRVTSIYSSEASS